MELIKAGYEESRVNSWIVDGRIREKPDGTWWSDVNPQARALSYEMILGGECGSEAMETIREEEVSILQVVTSPC